MRVSQENTTGILALSQELAQNGSQKTTSSIGAKTFKEQQDEKYANLGEIEGYRETFGLDSIENMTTAEYAAFQRATSNLSPAEKIKAAQSIHLVAAVYFQVQTDSLSKDKGSSVDVTSSDAVQSGSGKYTLPCSQGFFQNNTDVLTQGISALNKLNNNECKTMAGFLQSFSGALQSKGINVTA
jgi:hypothetical protein